MNDIIKKRKVDGIDVISWFDFGAEEIRLNKNYLNSINVFPVADCDTGTNLATTISAMSLKPIRTNHFSDMLKSISEAGMENARGNSGVIFSSFVTGLAFEGGYYDSVNLKEFSSITKKAVEYLYKTVENPIEGTMLSVMRDWSNYIYENHELFETFNDILPQAYEVAIQSLEKTTDSMSTLTKNSVVDSGAAGFVKFLDGINLNFSGGKTLKKSYQELNTEVSKFEILDDGNSKYKYCTEVFLKLKNILSTKELDNIKNILSIYGDSLIVINHDKNMRVHIHTDTPELVVQTLGEYGNCAEQKVDNMKLQNSVRLKKKHTVAIVTDSIADIPEEFKYENQIFTLPLGITFGDTTYLDKLTINLKQTLENIDKPEVLGTSSQPEPSRIKAFLNNLLETYDDIIFITVSSKMSGTFNLVKQEAEKLSGNGKRITVVDSRLNSGAQGLIVKEAADLLNKGASYEEIIDCLLKMIEKTKIYVCVDTLKYAVKGGRIPSSFGKFAVKVKLKAIMTIDKSGKGTAFGMGLGKNAITNKILKLIENTMKTTGIKAYAIVYSDDIDLALDYRDKIVKIVGKEPEFITDISSVVALHSGKGTVAVCFIEN